MPLLPYEQCQTPSAKEELRRLKSSQKGKNMKNLTGYTAQARTDYIHSLPGIDTLRLLFVNFPVIWM